MKFLKYSLLVLVLAIAADFCLVSALTEDASATYISETIEPNEDYSYTAYMNKTKESQQSYYNMDTYTTITNPCPKCVIAVKFQKNDGDHCERAVVQGQTVYAQLTSFALPGKYRIGLRRSDLTLVTTYTFGLWTWNA